MRPTKKQEQSLISVLIASRKMYNACLEELITHYQETGKHMHLYEQDKHHGKKELILPRIGGRGKASERLFQKEGKDHAKGSEDLSTRVEA
jgi:hypothetical protein